MITLFKYLQLIEQDRHPRAAYRDGLLIAGTAMALAWGYAYCLFCICY